MALDKGIEVDAVELLPLELMRKNVGEKVSPLANDVWVNECGSPHLN